MGRALLLCLCFPKLQGINGCFQSTQLKSDRSPIQNDPLPYEVLYNPDYLDSQKEITVPGGESKSVLITIAAPEGEPVEEHKYETWVGVGEKTGEMITVEYALRVLITTTAEMISLDIASPGTEKPTDWNRIMMFVFMGLSALLFLVLAGYTLRTRRKRE